MTAALQTLASSDRVELSMLQPQLCHAWRLSFFAGANIAMTVFVADARFVILVGLVAASHVRDPIC
eukprot:6223567-Amphidinium_carterae.1